MRMQIDVRLDEVVLRALEKKPELRYQQASVLKTQVETIVSESQKSESGSQKPEEVSKHFFPPGMPLSDKDPGDPFGMKNLSWWLLILCFGIGFLVVYILQGGRLSDYLSSDQFELSVALIGTFALLKLLFIVRKKRGRIVLVEVSNEKRKINWTNVIRVWIVIYAAFLAGTYIAFSRWVPFHDLIAGMVGAATLVTAALVQVELKKPLELLPTSGSRREEAQIGKGKIGNRKSNRVSRAAFEAAALIVIIGGILTFAFVRSHVLAPTSVTLSEAEFLHKFESNQIAHATIIYNPKVSRFAQIHGTYFQTNNDGNIIKPAKEAPFIVENALISPDLERELARSDKIVMKMPNPMFSAIGYNLLFLAVIGVSILFRCRNYYLLCQACIEQAGCRTRTADPEA